MKKALSVLSLIAILGLTSPAMAAPGGHGGPGRGHVVHAGHHHRPPAMHHHRHHRPPVIHSHHYRPHGGVYINTGYPRHRYWSSYGAGYWGDPWCDYRLSWCGPYHYPYRPHAGVYFPVGGAGVSIGF